MEHYFFMSLSAIGVLFLLGVAVLRDSLKGIKGDIANVREDVADVSSKVGGHAEELVRLSVTLIGPNGDNGINGEVRMLRRRLDDWDRRIATTAGRRAGDAA